MKRRLSKSIGVLTYVTDVLREPGRARLIWAAKTADATAQLVGPNKVLLISSRGFFSGIKFLISHGGEKDVGAQFREFYQVNQPLRAFMLPCLGLRIKWFKTLFILERKVGLLFFKYLVLPKLGVLHTRDYEAAKIALKKGVRVIYEDHDEDFHRSVRFDKSFLNSSLLLEVIAITKAVKERLLASGIPASKLKVRGSGVGKNQIVGQVRSESKASSQEQKKSVYCGGLHENRGVRYVLELALLFPQDKFVIVGGRNAQVRKWQKECSSPNVEFTGYLDQISADRIQESADYLLLPYKDPDLARITSPLKFFSYLAKGRPVLCSRMDEIEAFEERKLAVEWCDVGNFDSFKNGYESLRTKDWPADLLKENTVLALANTWESRQSSIIHENRIFGQINPRSQASSERAENRPTHRLRFSLVDRLSRLSSPIKYDWVFAMNDSAKGWVLETICHQIASFAKGEIKFVYTRSNKGFTEGLPAARRYWFAHFNQLVAALRKENLPVTAELYVWFTHFKETGISDLELVESLNSCRRVFCTCSEVLEKLKTMGVKEEILRCYIGGAHPQNYSQSKRLSKTVGISAGYYPRKNPDLILKIIQMMPDVEFLLIAPSPNETNNPGILWSSWEKYEEMRKQPNLKIHEAYYKDYPNLYSKIDVFFSASKREGGPISLIEAMMSNAYPVVSLTGFAPDIIKSKEHGLIFDPSSDHGSIINLLHEGLSNQSNVRNYAFQFSWENFAKKILKEITGELKN